MSISIETVKTALSHVIDPNTDKDLVSSKSAKNIRVEGNDVMLDVELGYPAKSQIENLRSLISSMFSQPMTSLRSAE